MTSNNCTVSQNLDHQVENNQLGISRLEGFLEKKNMELAQLQQYLIEEIQYFESAKENQQRYHQLFQKNILPFMSEVRQFSNSIIPECRKMVKQIIKESCSEFREYITSRTKKELEVIKEQQKELEQKNQVIEEQNKTINDQKIMINKIQKSLRSFSKEEELVEGKMLFVPIKKEIDRISQEKSQEKYNFEDRRERKFEKNNILAKSTTFLEYSLNRSKNKKQYSPVFQQTKSMIGLNEQEKRSSPAGRQFMRQVQKSLKQDHCRQNMQEANHKKYIKQKIENLKNRKRSNYLATRDNIPHLF